MNFKTEMDSEYHQNLTKVIKGVHQKLRKALFQSADPNKVWAEHLKEQDLRENYSMAMFKLATEIWTERECRIEWTYKTCLNYFFGGGLECSLMRQIKIAKIQLQNKLENASQSDECHELLQHNNYKSLNRKLRLLDVGSCYNPFSKFEEFCCIAIDLTPATKDVLQCDFLEAEIKSKHEGSEYKYSTQRLFIEESFDIVVLSLVLEYLPSPQQRALFCYKSWKLLQENGLFIIITPDSKSVNHNAHMMKSWKLALEKIGFVRVKYEKLQHIHCMAFRKLKKKTISLNQILQESSISELLFIPQDFKEYKEEHIIERTEEESYDICCNFLELPNDDLF